MTIWQIAFLAMAVIAIASIIGSCCSKYNKLEWIGWLAFSLFISSFCIALDFSAKGVI